MNGGLSFYCTVTFKQQLTVSQEFDLKQTKCFSQALLRIYKQMAQCSTTLQGATDYSNAHSLSRSPSRSNDNVTSITKLKLIEKIHLHQLMKS